jgi:hypothetical protein
MKKSLSVQPTNEVESQSEQFRPSSSGQSWSKVLGEGLDDTYHHYEWSQIYSAYDEDAVGVAMLHVVVVDVVAVVVMIAD